MGRSGVVSAPDRFQCQSKASGSGVETTPYCGVPLVAKFPRVGLPVLIEAGAQLLRLV
jgi:hypothetical protein